MPKATKTTKTKNQQRTIEPLIKHRKTKVNFLKCPKNRF